MKKELSEYMDYFKDQPLKEKQKIIYEQLQVLAGFTNKLCEELGVSNEVLLSREVLDLKSINYSEDDFAEAIIVLINSIQNSICDYANGIENYLDKVSEQQ